MNDYVCYAIVDYKKLVQINEMFNKHYSDKGNDNNHINDQYKALKKKCLEDCNEFIKHFCKICIKNDNNEFESFNKFEKMSQYPEYIINLFQNEYSIKTDADNDSIKKFINNYFKLVDFYLCLDI